MRRTDPPLRALQAQIPTLLRFSTGAPWTAKPGDWIVSMGETLIDVVPDKDFKQRYEPITDGLTLPNEILSQIEDTAGVGATKTPQSLLAAIRRLATVEIGTIKIAFSPGQLEEIKHRATKRGQSVQQTLQAIVDRIKDEIFFKS